MEIQPDLIKGLTLDVDPRKQPEGTWRDSRNGTFLQYGNHYVWRPANGTRLVLSLPQGEVVMNYTNIRDRYFMLALNTQSANPDEHVVKIYELTLSEYGGEDGNQVVANAKWYGNNNELNLSHEHPVRVMIGIYENEEIQRLYWSDDNSQPRVVNVGNTTGLITLEEKFVQFVPELENAYGNYEFDGVISGGALRAGSYFFCWRFYTGDGYYSDWSYLTNPIPLTGGNPTVNTYDGYQLLEGMEADTNTTKSIRLTLSNLDSDYPSIQIAAFYSNDDNSLETGIIFYDGSLAATTITVDYKGNENLGTVTIEEVVLTSITIDKAKDMAVIKNRSALANIKERPELDVTGMNTENKNDRFEVSIDIVYKEVSLDRIGAGLVVSPSLKAHTAPAHAATVYVDDKIWGGFWYQATATLQWTGDDTTVYNIPNGSKFYAPQNGDIDSGSAKIMIRIKKYRKAGATPPYDTGDYIAQSDDDDDYVWNEKELPADHWLDWKSPYISSMLRGYPGGEVIRLGVLFFDLAGRPYFVRWLKNTDITYGQNDITTPKRNDADNQLTVTYGDDTDSNGLTWAQVNGRTMGIKISDLNITDIKDQISGFMIVRAPIVRQYIANGALLMTHADTNDTYQSPGFVNHQADAGLRDDTYAFICPEHLLGITGFQIQDGDKLENMSLYYPFVKNETVNGLQGFGKQDGQSGTWFQKFVKRSTFDPNDNADVGATHEILYHIPYSLADAAGDTDKEEYDPRNPVLTYKRLTAEEEVLNRYGFLSDHSIVILDIDESGNDTKVPFNLAKNNPLLQLCAIKRENANPYGGTGDSSLANTIYIGVGHFQEITDTILAEIESNGLYVFNEIEIFGGDTYVQLFDIQRAYMEDESATRMGHAVVFPVESRLLLGYREGEHNARTRHYHSTLNTSGLRYRPGTGIKVEDFDYNDGYSTDHAGDFFLPLPFNFSLQSEYSVRMRYSNQKTYSELQDSYRVYPSSNVIDLDTKFGELNNIRSKFGRLAYWQDDAVGYMPIEERQLTQTEIGNPVQIGIGGVFERFDEIIDRIGNQHQFGLQESDVGFHWIDAKRKVYVTMTESFKIDESSLARGLDSWLQQNISDNLALHDRPGYDYGIAGGYDPKKRIVYHTLKLLGETYETIGFDVKLKAFIGFFDYPAHQYLVMKDHLYGMNGTSVSTKRNMYHHLTETKGNDVYGVSGGVESYLSLVFNDQTKDPKLWDTMETIASENFAEEITFEPAEDTTNIATDAVCDWSSPYAVLQHRQYKYRNHRWYHNVARANRQRLVSDYLLVKYRWIQGRHRGATDDIEIRSVVINYRKMF